MGDIFLKLNAISYLVVIVLFVGSVCHAQVTNNQDESNTHIIYINEGVEFQKMIEFENSSEADLYKVVNEWVMATFNSPGDVTKYRFENKLVQVEGIEPGIVLYKFPRSTASLRYILNLEVENNKLCFRMSSMEILTSLRNIYPFEMYVYNKEGEEILNRQSTRIKNHAIRVANVLINSLETFIVENAITRKWN